MRAQRRRSNHRIYTLPLRNLIPKCRNLGIGRRCRGRWLSCNRNSSRTAARGVGGKTQSAEPGPCKGRIFPAGGVGRRVLGWSWCSPPLRWTTTRTGSLPMPTKISILGVGSVTSPSENGSKRKSAASPIACSGDRSPTFRWPGCSIWARVRRREGALQLRSELP